MWSDLRMCESLAVTPNSCGKISPILRTKYGKDRNSVTNPSGPLILESNRPKKKQPLRKLTQAQVDEAVKRYEGGESLQMIAPDYKVSRQSMWDLLRRRTLMRPQKRRGEDNHFWRGGTGASDWAQNQVETAIQQGKMKKKTACEECGATGQFKDGRTKIQAHHPDYNEPLEVMWLC